MTIISHLPLLLIAYWTIKGLRDFLEVIPEGLENNRSIKKSSFTLKLLLNQLLPILVIFPTFIYLGLSSILGLTPSLPFFWYLFAPIIGLLILVISTISMMITQMVLTKFCPILIQKDLIRYQMNVSNGHAKLSQFQSILISSFNGISEELVMRVFLIGFISSQNEINIFTCMIISLSLNAIHHSYQGRVIGTLGAIYSHLPYALLYVFIKDFWLIAIAHIANDLIALLILPKIFNQK